MLLNTKEVSAINDLVNNQLKNVNSFEVSVKRTSLTDTISFVEITIDSFEERVWVWRNNCNEWVDYPR